MNIFKTTKQNEEWWRGRRIDWVSHYWSPDHPHRDVLINILKTQPPRSVLEIGCGAGANLYRIKKAFPDCRVCGCDINADAIATAESMFRREFPKEHFEKHSIDWVSDIDFRVGDITAVPFHGEYFDLVLTDACLIYIGPDKIERALRELRRLSYDKFMMCEFNSSSWFKRVALRLASNYYAYDYLKLLSDKHFKYIKLTKITKDLWDGPPWSVYGYFITSVR